MTPFTGSESAGLRIPYLLLEVPTRANVLLRQAAIDTGPWTGASYGIDSDNRQAALS
jgi:hypothetical protein